MIKLQKYVLGASLTYCYKTTWLNLYSFLVVSYMMNQKTWCSITFLGITGVTSSELWPVADLAAGEDFGIEFWPVPGANVIKHFYARNLRP